MPATLNVKLNAQTIRQPLFFNVKWMFDGPCERGKRERERVNSLCLTVWDLTDGVAKRGMSSYHGGWCVDVAGMPMCVCRLFSVEMPASGAMWMDLR